MKACIIGSARSGIAAARLLAHQGYQVDLLDKNTIDRSKLKGLNIRYFEGEHDKALWDNKYDLIVKNPGIPSSNPFVQGFVKQGYTIYNEIELALRYAKHFHIGAVTGTNGKTTVTTLLGEMLIKQDASNKVAGNIGIPLSEIADEHKDEEISIALEIAAFQLEGCPSFKPQIAVILNLSPDHLDVYPNAESYYNAKALVFKNQDEHNDFLLNLDDETIVSFKDRIKANIITFSAYKQEADYLLSENTILYKGRQLFDLSQFKLMGQHNQMNAMAASMMAIRMGVTEEIIQEVLDTFSGVEHRLEYVDEIDGVRYYNDSKATTVESTLAALSAFDQPIILLAGGYDKHTGYDLLLEKKDKVKKMICYGNTKDQLKALFEDAIVCENMQEALKEAHGLAQKGDIVVLSPASASYDQFKNFEERGSIFKNRVKMIKNNAFNQD